MIKKKKRNYLFKTVLYLGNNFLTGFIKFGRKMSLVLCNLGSSGPRRNNSNSSNSNEQNASASNSAMPRNSTSSSVAMPSSSSASALHRAAMHTSQSSSTLNQTVAGNDKNNNTNSNANDTDDANQVTIYR